MTEEKKDPKKEDAEADAKAEAEKVKVEQKKPAKRDPVKTWTAITLLLLVILFVGRIFSDKFVPYTANLFGSAPPQSNKYGEAPPVTETFAEPSQSKHTSIILLIEIESPKFNEIALET